jgi:arginyl-tRNA synthetase
MLQSIVEPFLRDALNHLEVPADTPLPLEYPRQEGFGHLSTTVAMGLARSLRQNPRVIAQSIVDALPKDIAGVESVSVAGAGFINFTFSADAFQRILSELQSRGEQLGRSLIGAGATVNVEYVSANPTGFLHAGHGRNCAVGDTLASLYSWCGYNVTREYYFNNAGNQMNKLGESIMVRLLHVLGHSDEVFPEDGYHGEYITTIAEHIAETQRAAVLQMDREALHAHCKKQGELWCFDAIRSTLKTLGISHDVFFNEDSLYSDGKVDETVAALRSLGLVYESEGATWFALTKLGQQQDKVIIKSSGEATYRLPDIAYHRDKLERGFDVLVDVFGADHIATIPDVLAGVQALGFDTTRVRVVIHQMVSFLENGEAVKFSKRSGTSFTLDDLINEVGADVVRFFFVMRAVGTHLEFDLALAKEEGDRNPVFYLQYAHARICSILRRADEKGLRLTGDEQLTCLKHPSEIHLILSLSRFQETVERACLHLEPHTLCDYLRDLAGAYHAFYHDCRILGEDPAVERARLALADVTRAAMKNGLTILGVSAPEQM